MEDVAEEDNGNAIDGGGIIGKELPVLESLRFVEVDVLVLRVHAGGAIDATHS